MASKFHYLYSAAIFGLSLSGVYQVFGRKADISYKYCCALTFLSAIHLRLLYKVRPIIIPHLITHSANIATQLLLIYLKVKWDRENFKLLTKDDYFKR